MKEELNTEYMGFFCPPSFKKYVKAFCKKNNVKFSFVTRALWCDFIEHCVETKKPRRKKRG
jgi:hypothetical protein